MDEDDVWQAIDTQRQRIADLLEQLTDDEWRHSSLCDGWTVRRMYGGFTFTARRTDHRREPVPFAQAAERVGTGEGQHWTQLAVDEP